MFALLIVVICIAVLYVLSQGAPYVPTLKKDAEIALKLMKLKQGDVVVDIGAGDGAVLKRAAERGYGAVGIELNPLLWAVATLRLRQYRHARVSLGNVWRWHLPSDVAGIFLFTAGPFAKRMTAWLEQEQRRLGRPLVVVSLGFQLPGYTPVKTEGGCILYRLH